MAKKIRFPLKMNDTDVRSLEELQENFEIEAVIGYFSSGKLVTWLRDRYYDDEADSIEALSPDDEALGTKLAQALGVTISDQTDVDIEAVKHRQEKLDLLGRYTADHEILDNVDIVAIDQDDLYDILDSGANKVYLFRETFSVPVNKKGVSYIGLNGAKVKLQSETDCVINAANIHFENLDFSLSDDADNIESIALCYYYGNGVNKNIKKAVELFIQVAEQANPDIQYLLGDCYYTGNEVEQNYKEAVKWYTKAAEQGNPEAQYKLGEHYYSKEKNDDEAKKWFAKAAEHGNSDALDKLGMLLLRKRSR